MTDSPWARLGLDYMYRNDAFSVPFSIATEMRSSNGNGPVDPVLLGLYPIVTLQYSSTTLYQVSYHIR
jgi:hypothetical protein